jgi:hypothetical protein
MQAKVETKSNDASIEELFSSFKEPKDLLCDEGKEITVICLNPECEDSSLACYDFKC